MPIDRMLLKRAAERASMGTELTINRVSKSDVTEAKANVEAQRIIDSGAQIESLKEEVKDEYESSSSGVRTLDVPSMDSSGLVDPDIILDESQVKAINMLVKEQYGCLIGAAGTGKTTCQRFFLHKLIYGDDSLEVRPMDLRMLPGKQGINIALCAFTGIATQVIKQNMPEWLHPACKTIHSLLEFAPVATEIQDSRTGEMRESRVFMPMRNKVNKLDHKIILIDEASMVGLDLWHMLLDACRPGTKIFLTGDLNQLPPVGSQSMFAYALSEWPVSELTHIHRQKEPAANKIIDVAHSILEGKEFELDDPTVTQNWRVIGFEVDANPQKAGTQIVTITNALRSKRVSKQVDPEESLVYDPYRDRVITAGNGYDENNANSSVQQHAINEALSQLIEPPSEEHPRFIIDAGIAIKKFAVGHRVMATRNEPPDVPDRVTNGMTGRVIDVTVNHAWEGNRNLVGSEDEVQRYKKEQLNHLFGNGNGTEQRRQEGDLTVAEEAESDMSWADKLDEISLEGITISGEKSREGAGPASHNVTVQFMNGAVRTFKTKMSVASLQLAYASTCHKCQGSQMDTAIVIVHHVAKGQLSREWLYTAVTRAAKRVIFLYTKYGIRAALAKQKIFGRNLQEKIERYKVLSEEADGMLRKGGSRVVRLRVE